MQRILNPESGFVNRTRKAAQQSRLLTLADLTLTMPRMAISPAVRAYLSEKGRKGGKASWRGLSKAQRTARARKAAQKRHNGNNK